MVTTLKTRMPDTGLSCFVACVHPAHTAPVWTEQGTGLSFAGPYAPAGTPDAQVAFGARVIDLLGPPPRGAPV